MQKAHYSPPWANTSIIGVAGSSGSGKTSLALAITQSLNLPWVVILSMVFCKHLLPQYTVVMSDLLRPTQDSFYKVLTPEQSRRAFQNDYDFDSPDAIDFDALIERLEELKAG